MSTSENAVAAAQEVSQDRSEAPFLEALGVCKRFDEALVVDGIDLSIRRGEFVTLLGPSGCGKTTLLRMIAGFEQPSAGAIRLEGADLLRHPPERRPLNMVFQSYALFPHMDVYDNVAYGLRTARVRPDEVRRRVRDVLELVGLEHAATRAVSQLSGGMSQRVAVARAIVNEPSVLLLDEPLAALDLQLRKRMQVELRHIQQRTGTTFVYVTHDQEEALVMSHRIVLMQGGRVVQVGTPESVYHRPANRFVAEFIGEATLLACTVEEHTGDTVRVRPAGGRGDSLLEIPAPGAAPAAVGAEALLALRPEHLRLAAPESARFTGVVTDRIFLGAKTHYLVEIGDGVQMRAEGDELGVAEHGTRVGIDVVRGRGAVVAEDAGAG